MKRKIQLLVATLGIIACASSAQAFYVLEAGNAGGPAQQDICLQPGVVGGEYIRDSAPLVGYGNGIPLRTALQMIFPKNWRGIVSPVVENAKVSWESGSPWIATVNHIAQQNNLCVKVRPSDQVLLIEQFVAPAIQASAPAPVQQVAPAPMAPVPVAEPVAAPVQQVAAPVAPSVPTQVAPAYPIPAPGQPATPREPALTIEELPSTPTVPVPAASAPVVQEEQAMQQALGEIERSMDFTLNEGAQIHEELERWCQAAGWTLFWRPSLSWKVLKTTRIPEKDVVSAVQRVIETLRHEKKPVRMEVYRGNNVIEIISTGVAIK